LLLGPPLLEQDGTEIEFDRRKAIALIAYLAVSLRKESREALATLLWPDLDRERSLAGLRRVLASLRNALDDEVLEISRQRIGLNPESNTYIDVREFDKLCSVRPREGDIGSAEWEPVADSLGHAVELYRGDFLAGFSLSDTEAFDGWQLLQSQRLSREFTSVLEYMVLGLAERREFERAIEYSHRWVEHDPLSESAHQQIMKIHALAGRIPEAIRQYEHCVELLDRELQVPPQPETVLLFRAIKDGEFAPVPAGELRLSVVSRPVQALPVPPTPFIGREIELQKITELLSQPSCRLVTLTGPGGIGKTRLSLEAAQIMNDSFKDEVCFVPLSQLSSPHLVGSRVCEALGLQPDPQVDPQDLVVSYLQDKEILLVVDNFEHLLPGSTFLSGILLGARGVKMLVTSRERLRLQGESVFEVSGLETPEAGQTEGIEKFSAVRLFIESANRIDKAFAVSAEDRSEVSRICRLVQGMPLALELAAAWTRVLGCSEIAAEIESNIDFLAADLRDMPERHRSLRAVFNHTFALLTREEQRLASSLSVLRGSFTREAAEQAADTKLTGLLSLLDKSLLSRTKNDRYQMHELLRQFALEQLKRSPEDENGVRERHSRYFLELLFVHSELLSSARQRSSLKVLHNELENVRDAWEWAIRQEQVQSISKTADGLYRLHLILSRHQEGEELFMKAASAVSPDASPFVWALLTSRQCRFRIALGRFENTLELLREGLKIFRAHKDDREIAFSLGLLSSVHYYLGEYEASEEKLKESFSAYRVAGDRHGTANSLLQMGRLAGAVGDYERARLAVNESYVIFEELGDEDGTGKCCINLGNIALLSGSYLEARRLFQEGFETFARLDNRKGMAFTLSNLGLVSEELEDHSKARDLSMKGLELLREIGDLDAVARVLENLGRANFELGDYGESKRYYLEALRITSRIKSVPIALIALIGIARLLANDAAYQKACQILVFVRNHPKANQEARKRSDQLLSEYGRELSSRLRKDATRQGNLTEFGPLVDEILKTEEEIL
jgi:predicted ATPase/DNA-binding SARP family transcriptional activator